MPGVLYRLPCSSAPAVDRGWVAATSKHRRDCCRGFAAQRSGRVPIEIGLQSIITDRPPASAVAHLAPVAALLLILSQWARPLVPSTRRSHTSASETDLR